MDPRWFEIEEPPDRGIERVADAERERLDDPFLRMWEFYLGYCEGGFDERVIGVSQVVFEKPLSGIGRIPAEQAAA